MNIECPSKVRDELENSFRFNDAVIRNLIVKMNHAVTDPSPMARPEQDSD
jgi:small subunit ribosomal protein S6